MLDGTKLAQVGHEGQRAIWLELAHDQSIRMTLFEEVAPEKKVCVPAENVGRLAFALLAKTFDGRPDAIDRLHELLKEHDIPGGCS